MMSGGVLECLCSTAKLERDKGVVELQKSISTLSDSELNELQEAIVALYRRDDSPWETKHGALKGTAVILHSKRASRDFVTYIKDNLSPLLDDEEFRVRLAAGEAMGALCESVGVEIYIDAKVDILRGIADNLEREPSAADQEDNARHDEIVLSSLSSGGSSKSFSLSRCNSAEKIFHDTAGWKSLETWMKCLQSVIVGCGTLFNSQIDQELLDLIFLSLKHTNRFVRETGFYVCSAIVNCTVDSKGGEQPVVTLEDNAVYLFGDQLAIQLGFGLSDNWSQVRLAASVATRNFIVNLPSTEARAKFFPVLLPRMCLNRYYAAEGVRIYSQETWRLVTDGRGKQLVEQYIDQVVQYYVEQTYADNHSVREAGCACIAELGSKIDKDAIRPYIGDLLNALVACFQDDSWPVRDAACLASGNFIECFPDECKCKLEVLFPLFFANLRDNIPSVRQGAAQALCNVVKAYGDECRHMVVSTIKEGLTGIEQQAATAEKYSNLDKGLATYGVAKQLRDNDMELHTDKQMYSCGSLAPKMGRGGGCMDHKFRKPAEPWEYTDGCINLVAELASLPPMSSTVTQLLPFVANAASFRHYTQHLYLLETVCKRLPALAYGIGKRNFKSQLETFFDCVFYALTCDSPLTSSAASQCLNALGSFLGPSILRGRVEIYNPKYLEMLDANQYIAPL
ncbi:XP_029652912.1uncharacterized protein LOC115226077 [Octopus vulgaris]|uniref:XP_029652912.1uncharacterized protein LOC115226077 n=1 Tax=Octopus vulgaris TaxID=6645 RepID=A0AA36C2K7_OCTVU|nr:XP_029652912.1uncharacterized protein LOC115226077 [Octopus vulgaris]